MRALVFVGPSAPLRKWTDHDIELRPPARRGDIVAAIDSGFRVIILIDGVMVEDYPPSPAELASAIDGGAQVYGAASLGALRAVELRPRMIGIGWVFRMYLQGKVWRDDELVSSLFPESYRSLTIPLINIRYAALKLGEQTPDLRPQLGRLLEVLASMYFEERTNRSVLEIGLRLGLPQAMCKQLCSDQYNIKQRDFNLCIRRVRADLSRMQVSPSQNLKAALA